MKDTEKIQQGQREDEEGFGELLRYTAAGFVGGLLAAAIFDLLGLQRSSIGQWVVRTLSGEGESILEGLYAFRRWISKKLDSMAEAYGWGKFFGMIVPWIIDWGSRIAGINVYGIEGFYIPYLYAMSDQIGANISGFIFLRRKTGSFFKATKAYFHQPVMLASLLVIFAVPIGLLIARFMGFSPRTQILTAAETIVANLCWLPPFVGWLAERQK